MLVLRDLQKQYTKFRLGYLWTLLEPLGMSLVLWFVFSVLLGARALGQQPYVLFLSLAILPWWWFTKGISASTRVFRRAGGQLRDGTPAGDAMPGTDKRRLVQMAGRLLGNHAGPVIGRLEKSAESSAELLASIESCYKLIKLTIDEKKAEQFREAGRRVSCPLLALWGANGVVERCFRPLEDWGRVATSVSGRALPAGHYLPEEVPGLVADEFESFFGD